MKLETFFEKFDQFADAPDAVRKMRNLALGLAFRGGLSGETAAVGTLPIGWSQKTIASIASSITPGFACSRSNEVEGGHVHLRTHNISTLGTLNFDLLIKINPQMVDLQKKSVLRGDILFNNTNSQELVGKTCIVDRDYDYGFSNHITRIRVCREIEPRFVVFYLTWLRNCGHFANICTRWINQAAVNTNALKEQLIPLPSLRTQEQIVAKIDELMELCNRLETQQKEREERHIALSRAAIARFDEATNPANLSLLFHGSYSIAPADLREAILNLAVEGRLTDQRLTDESAAEVLKRLADQGSLEHTIRRNVPVEVNIPEIVDVTHVSKSWLLESTAKLIQLGVILDLKDGNHGANHPKAAEFTKTGLPFITAAQVAENGDIDYEGAYKISGEPLRRLRVGFARPRDVIYTHKGSVGRVGICTRECVLSPQTTYYRLNSEVLIPEYVRILLLSPFFRVQVDEVKRQTTRDFVSISAQYRFFLKIPPIEEQSRIIAKTGTLLRLVDQLEMELAASEATARELIDAMVHELPHPSANISELPSSNQDHVSDRAAVLCYAVQRLAQSPNFGRTMNMKIGYMAETHLGLSLGWQPERQAAGPWDPWIGEFDAMGRREGWFTVTEKSLGNGHTKYDYTPKAALKEKASEAVTILGKQKGEFDRMLSLFADRSTEEAEIIATLFAAWNDFLIDGKSPSDDDIIREVRENWHVSKQRFTPSLLGTWLKWLRSNRLVPQGRPPRTKQQLRLAM